MSSSQARVRQCNSRSINIRQLNYTKRTNFSLNHCQNGGGNKFCCIKKIYEDDTTQWTVKTAANILPVSQLLREISKPNSSQLNYKTSILKTQELKLNQTILLLKQDTDHSYVYRQRLHSQMENTKSYTHYLEDFVQGRNTIQSYIESCKSENEQMKRQYLILKIQIQSLKNQMDDDLKDTAESFFSVLNRIKSNISQDYANHQQNQFQMNKDIIKIKRETNNIINQIESCQNRISQLENQLYGVELFNLKDVNQPSIILNNHQAQEQMIKSFLK